MPAKQSYQPHPWSKWLQQTRQTRGLSAKQCAEASGVSQSQWSKWESGSATGNVETLRRVARALRVAEEEIFKQAGVQPVADATLPLGEFERKMLDDRPSKERVAEAAAREILRTGVRQILANDGSSTTYCIAELLRRWAEVRPAATLELHTNNTQLVDEVRKAAETAISRQRLLQVELTLAPGRFDVRDRATTGAHTAAWVRGTAPSCTCVLATTGLDALSLGPSARGEEAARIKVPMVEEAPLLFVLASATKLAATAHEMELRDYHLYSDMADAWQRRLKRPETLWVVSDLDEKVAPLVDMEPGPQDEGLSSPLQQQLRNARFLREVLRSQFIVAPERKDDHAAPDR